MTDPKRLIYVPGVFRTESVRWGYMKGWFAGERYGIEHKEPPTMLELETLLEKQDPERLPKWDKEEWSAGYKAGFKPGFDYAARKAFE